MPPKKSNKHDSPRPINVSFELDDIIGGLPQPTFAVAGGKPTKHSGTTQLAEITSDMDSYVEINKTGWMSVPVDTYIRYTDQEGKWRPGARVKSIKQNTDGSYAFEVGKFNPFIKKYTKWRVPFNNIAILYKLKDDNRLNTEPRAPRIIATTAPANISPEVTGAAGDSRESNEQQILGQLGNKLLFEDGEMIRHKVEGLEAELQRMNEDLKSLVTLIKRIYTRLDKAGVP